MGHCERVEIKILTPGERRAAIALGKQLQKECQHEVTAQYGDDPEYDDDGSCRCSICGKDLGWWCPNSPHHYCEYFGNHRGGHPGRNGWSYEGEWYDEDNCIYCCQPEERK